MDISKENALRYETCDGGLCTKCKDATECMTYLSTLDDMIGGYCG